ncbi:protein phosphatase 2C domain-containing protein [Streptomyces sp. NBC_01387]|uniref:protein phosphatase 2C domain-containing protein n=1 Tax=unclassified Streptomyces TaxID=2593676 RepID=UPI00202519DE|nr:MULTISPECIES: protein phosphatase 2C domain-containing protein [unclassified Streptomyces]MCX4548239.1 protein phosphatase 2C domain-containing protein [Streptomyces sp. NBC_01500]WSC19889.1 protein phosphatase 2C domain-containing protein [Streptomyces sp. NBC_01766]
MRIELTSTGGSPERPNEDWTGVALPASGQGGAIVLLDGVTPPEGDDGCVHGVPWFTARLGGALVELSGSRGDMNLREVLAEAIVRTSDAHRQTCDLSHVRTPQATVVLARWSADTVEHLVLSDSILLVEDVNGAVRAVLDDRLDRLPREVLATHATADAVRNQEGGFFTAAADPAVVARAVTGRTPLAEVRALAALSDGASRWVEVFGEGDWSDCFGVLRKEGPQGLIDRVRALESADATDRTFLRNGKTHDDASALLLEL